MTKIKKFFGTMAVALALIAPTAVKADDCNVSLSRAKEMLIEQRLEHYWLTTRQEVNEAFDRIQTYAEVGTTSAVAVVGQEKGIIAEFSDECLILESPPLPVELVNRFLGRRNASQ